MRPQKTRAISGQKHGPNKAKITGQIKPQIRARSGQKHGTNRPYDLFYIFPLIRSFYIFVFHFCVCLFSSYSVLFCFFHSFCLFLFSYFESRFNIFASIYVIIIFIDSFCVCINLLWDRCGRKSNFDEGRSLCGLGRNQDFGEEK